MPGNDFEKQVHDKMEELKFRPGEPVWKNIKKQISKKEKKRRFLFILPLLAGLLILGYPLARYFRPSSKMSQSADNNLKMERAVSDSNKFKVEENKKSNSGIYTKPEKSITVKVEKDDANKHVTGKNITEPGLANTATSKRKKPESIAEGDKYVANQTKKIDPVLKEEPITDAIHPDNEAEKTLAIDNKIKKELTSKEASIDQKEGSIEKNELAGISELQQGKDSLSQLKNNEPAKVSIADLGKPSKEKVKRNSGITLQLSFGIADVRNRVLAFSDKDKSLLNPNGGGLSGGGGSAGGGGGGGYPIPITPASETKTGFAFKGGLTWDKAITSKSRFSVGLVYALYSDHLKVGQKSYPQVASNYLNDVFNNGVYAATPDRRYNNHFHFIEIPLVYTVQINKSKRIPISWNGGLSVARLISSNALMYDTLLNGVYYNSWPLLTKTHFNLLTGFSFRLGNGKRNEWEIGPQWSIDITRIANEGLEKDRYLWGGYLQARMLFNRKEKKK